MTKKRVKFDTTVQTRTNGSNLKHNEKKG